MGARMDLGVDVEVVGVDVGADVALAVATAALGLDPPLHPTINEAAAKTADGNRSSLDLIAVPSKSIFSLAGTLTAQLDKSNCLKTATAAATALRCREP